ncbi:MAG: Ig-like domain-containing protein [Clostridia bacterium]|nr:Ig-like domain-containing protein [Clostridia bacterium]
MKCDAKTFRAKVVDEKGNPVEGVNVNICGVEDNSLDYDIKSDKNGIASYTLTGVDFMMPFDVSVSDANWTSEDEHGFETDGTPLKMPSIVSVDGKSLAEADEVIFTVKKNGTAADKVLCEGRTFRAKVVDEKGTPVEGVSVLLKDDKNYGCEYTVTSGKDGVVSHEMNQNADYSLTFNVNVKDSAWTSENTHTFVTGGDASITKVNGKAPADADEMVFVVKKGGTPAPTKVLSDSTHFRAVAVDKDGKPVAGAVFTVKVPGVGTHEITSNEKGVIEYALDKADDYDNTLTVELKANDKWSSMDSYKVVTNAMAEIYTVNNKPLSDEEFSFILHETVDKTALGEALDKVKNLVKTDYTDESWSDYSMVLDKAQKVYDNDYVNNDDVTNAIQELEAAVKKLTVKAVDTAKADEAKADAAKLQKDNYTPESWKAVEDALAELEKVSKGENVLQSELDATVEKLTQAISDLKEAEKPEPEAKKVASVKLSTTTYTYNGKVKKPAVTAKDDKNNVIPKSAYTVKYSSGCKSVGKYTATVTFRGDYSGSFVRSFQIIPKGTKIKSLKAGKKSFTVKWTAQKTQTTGYQVQYCLKKNFKKGAKTTTVGKNKTVSKKITKRGKKKTYYVRIRTYKTVKVKGKNTKLYSGWSAVKKVKTK